MGQRKVYLTLIVTIFFSLFTVNAIAQSWGARGESAHLSCGRFLALFRETPLGKAKTMEWEGDRWYGAHYVHLQWVWGFLSGMNFARQEPKSEIGDDPETVELWLVKSCEANPSSTLVDVVTSFTSKQLHRK